MYIYTVLVHCTKKFSKHTYFLDITSVELQFLLYVYIYIFVTVYTLCYNFKYLIRYYCLFIRYFNIWGRKLKLLNVFKSFMRRKLLFLFKQRFNKILEVSTPLFFVNVKLLIYFMLMTSFVIRKLIILDLF